MNKKVIVITGGSAGVGRAAAVRFGQDGSKIGVLARGEQRLKETKNQIELLGGTCEYFLADVANPNELESAADFFESKLGPIDIWVNNAMTTVFSSFNEIRAEDFKRVTEVTYLGFIYGTMSALKRMRERNMGTIVQVGSALAYRGIPLQSAYCGAKHGIQGFTESVRSELIHDKVNVRLVMVQMPALNTPQFNWCKSNFEYQPQPVPPIYQPEVAAEAIYYAAYHDKREMYVGFRNSIIIYGNKFFPGFGDRYLASHGYSSQMTNKKIDKNRPDNLWNPVDANYGAHGQFSSKAIKKSMQVYFDTHPSVTAALLAFIFILIIAGVLILAN
jgi:short-subunit dehydrogenase